MQIPVKLLRKLVALSKSERRTLISCFSVLLVVRIGLTVLGFRRLQRFIRPAHERAPLEILQLTGWAIRHAARLVPGASCLTQALAAQIMLARSGYGASLRVGVARTTAGNIRAHAWLTSGDFIIIGGDPDSLAEYSVFAGRLTPTA